MHEFINSNGWTFWYVRFQKQIKERKQIKFFQCDTFKNEKTKDKLITYTMSALFN